MFSFFLHFGRRLRWQAGAKSPHPNGHLKGHRKYLVRLEKLPSPNAGRIERLKNDIREGRYPTFEAIWGAAARLADLFLKGKIQD